MKTAATKTKVLSSVLPDIKWKLTRKLLCASVVSGSESDTEMLPTMKFWKPRFRRNTQILPYQQFRWLQDRVVIGRFCQMQLPRMRLIPSTTESVSSTSVRTKISEIKNVRKSNRRISVPTVGTAPISANQSTKRERLSTSNDSENLTSPTVIEHNKCLLFQFQGKAKLVASG